MPEDAARKSIIREFMRESGLRYTAARRELELPLPKTSSALVGAGARGARSWARAH